MESQISPDLPPHFSASRTVATREEAQPAIAWAAALAGGVVAVAITFVLLMIGTGFGFHLVSVWPGGTLVYQGFDPYTGGWLVGSQAVASALGGYICGRLRTRWDNVHGHEVHFRDTAHGLLSWAVATVIGVILTATVLQPHDLTLVSAEPVARRFAMFMGIGLLLGAFISAVAAAIGGLRREEMHAKAL